MISSSYGYCEPAMIQGGKNVATAEAAIFQEMAVQGQSMLAASGDAGSEQCLPYVSQIHAAAYQLEVGDPASQPFVTAVGGTEITRLGSPPVEAAWNQSGPAGNGAGFPAPFDGMAAGRLGYPHNLVGNGGISEFWTMPAWQRGFDTSGNSSGGPVVRLRGRTAGRCPTSRRWPRAGARRRRPATRSTARRATSTGTAGPAWAAPAWPARCGRR